MDRNSNGTYGPHYVALHVLHREVACAVERVKMAGDYLGTRTCLNKKKKGALACDLCVQNHACRSVRMSAKGRRKRTSTASAPHVSPAGKSSESRCSSGVFLLLHPRAKCKQLRELDHARTSFVLDATWTTVDWFGDPSTKKVLGGKHVLRKTVSSTGQYHMLDQGLQLTHVRKTCKLTYVVAKGRPPLLVASLFPEAPPVGVASPCARSSRDMCCVTERPCFNLAKQIDGRPIGKTIRRGKRLCAMLNLRKHRSTQKQVPFS